MVHDRTRAITVQLELYNTANVLIQKEVVLRIASVLDQCRQVELALDVFILPTRNSHTSQSEV